MAFQLWLASKAQKELGRVDKSFQIRIFATLAAIKRNPFSGKKLNGEHADRWSYRVWPYRIIYALDKKDSVILVVRISDRKDVYK